jgi:hypothetical protein
MQDEITAIETELGINPRGGFASVVARLNSVSFTTNTFANRGSPSTDGRYFYASDTGALYRDNGTTWVQVNTDRSASLIAGAVLTLIGGAGNFEIYSATGGSARQLWIRDAANRNAVMIGGDGDATFDDQVHIKAGNGLRAKFDASGQFETTLRSVFDRVNLLGSISGAAGAIDFASYPVHTGTVSGTITSMSFTWPTMGTDQCYTTQMELLVSGAYTIAWPSEVKWVDNTAPTLTSSKYHQFMFQRLSVAGSTRTRGTFIGIRDA